ncbi:MAG: diguanylate cyclase [Pseudomonadales bacterium]|nr:diguanylate cyclase [Pseudomonadales bacterium]
MEKTAKNPDVIDKLSYFSEDDLDSQDTLVNVYKGRVKLRFVALLEGHFQASYALQHAYYMRMTLIVLSLLFIGSGAFDYLLLDGEIQLVWLLRYGVGMPMLLAILSVSRTRYFMRYQQWVLSLAILSTVFAMSLMMAQLPKSEGQFYFTGLLIIQMAGLNILRLQFRYALLCSVLIPVCGFTVQFWFGVLNSEGIMIEMYFYTSVSALSLASNFLFERSARRDYIQKRLLTRKQDYLLEANEHLKVLVDIDGLTGIANRRHFDEELYEEWRRAKRTNGILAILMVDIDFFKAYNDCYGHQQGDNCLKVVAKVINQFGKRPGDLVARYGGEEFVVILSGVTASDARKIGKQICKSVLAKKIKHEKSSVANYVTVSVGVASADPFHLNSSDELVQLADKSLYRAKSQGRNQVVLCID